MKLIDYYKRGLVLAGQQQNEETVFMGDAPDELFYINQALADLKEESAESVFDEKQLSPLKADALGYGIAYLLSIHAENAKMSSYLAAVYNGKRAAALSETAKIKNIF